MTTMPSTPRRLSRLVTTGSAAITIAVILQGCLLNRLDTAQAQACDWRNAVHVTAGARPSLRFAEPLLLRSDVETVMGFSPSEVHRYEDRWRWTYIVEKVEEVEEAGEAQALMSPTRYVTELTFREHDGKPRLERLELPPEAGPFLTDEALGELFGELCTFEGLSLLTAGGFQRTLSPQQLDAIPDRQTLLSLLGTPTAETGNGQGLRYEYRLIGTEEPVPVGGFTVWFDRGSSKPTRFEGHSQRMVAKGNLRTGEFTVDVTL